MLFAPELRQMWDDTQNRLGDSYLLNPIDEASALDWIIFELLASRSSTLKSKLIKKALVGIASSAVSRIAEGVELWLVAEYLPNVTGSEMLRTGTTKTGKRHRMDDLTKLDAMLRSRRTTGSTRAFLHGASGDRHLDEMLTKAMCNVHLGSLQPAFAGARRLSLAWDPGSYSGQSFNIGLCYSVDDDIAATLPITVGHHHTHGQR